MRECTCAPAQNGVNRHAAEVLDGEIKRLGVLTARNIDAQLFAVGPCEHTCYD
jgi:hypothetical protein